MTDKEIISEKAMDSKNDNDEKIVLLPAVQGNTSNFYHSVINSRGKKIRWCVEAAAFVYSLVDNGTDNEGNPVNVYDKEKIEAFEAGAQWQKEQMMKNAISMDVYYETEWDDIHKFLRKNLDGEKVKLLIIREE